MCSAGASFSLVMIDLDLPGRSGFSLIREMWRHFPDLSGLAIASVFPSLRSGEIDFLGAAGELAFVNHPAWKETRWRVSWLHSSTAMAKLRCGFLQPFFTRRQQSSTNTWHLGTRPFELKHCAHSCNRYLGDGDFAQSIGLYTSDIYTFSS
jgi:hypothetical protein